MRGNMSQQQPLRDPAEQVEMRSYMIWSLFTAPASVQEPNNVKAHATGDQVALATADILENELGSLRSEVLAQRKLIEDVNLHLTLLQLEPHAESNSGAGATL